MKYLKWNRIYLKLQETRGQPLLSGASIVDSNSLLKATGFPGVIFFFSILNNLK